MTPRTPALAADRANAPAGAPPAVAELRSVSKSFGPTHAVSDVSIQVRSGEVLALLGENGAGKSTAVKMLAGIYPPDSGAVVVEGAEVSFATPLDAHRAGIAVVHQSPTVFGDLSVAENIYAGQLPGPGAGLLDRRQMETGARRWLDVLGLRIPPSRLARHLRTGEQQLIEIARALASDARVLIMDEPTAALSSHEVATLFRVVGELRTQGVAMMFVGHRLEEVFQIADRITVLRDGRHVGTAPAADLTSAEVVRMMVGRDIDDLYPHQPVAPGEVVISVDGLTRAGQYEDIGFEVRAGEIVGLGGLVGAGRTEVARTLFGITRPQFGTIRIDGEAVRIGSSRAALAHGIAYVSEDRRGQSLVADFSILDNATLPVLRKSSRFGIVSRVRELAAVDGPLRRMRLKFASYDQPAGTLSGGNQQKVVLAKWMATEPRVLILDEPTQGIDVQAKAEVHRIISGLAEQGMAIILISSDMPELIAMSDRVVVMREGRQTAVLDRARATPEAIGAAAMGAEGVSSGSRAPDTSTLAVPRASSGFRQVLGRLDAARELGLLGAILAIAIPVAVLNPRFLDGGNLTSILVDASLLLIVGAGQMLVMLTGNIDVSVSSIVGLSAYVAAMTVRDNPGWPLVLVVLVAILVGLACGAVNGFVIAYGRVPAIVATLGTLAVFRGVDSFIAGGKQITFSDVPQSWLDLASLPIGPIPLLIAVAIGVLALLAAALRWTRAGREFFQVGSSPASASLIGIDVRGRVLSAYLLCGALSGLAGAMWASHFATVDSRVANGIELTVIASVIVGGVAIAGGVGTVAGIVFGTLLLLLIRNGLSLVRVDPLWLLGAYGFVILAAVVVNWAIARGQRERGTV
jgi:ribose transport system ATP-binding protein/rhamnose transport system ATP-binding protein